MEKIKTIINSPLMRVGITAAIGTVLLFENHLLYAGLAFGIGLREFFLAFKSN